MKTDLLQPTALHVREALGPPVSVAGEVLVWALGEKLLKARIVVWLAFVLLLHFLRAVKKRDLLFTFSDCNYITVAQYAPLQVRSANT